LRNGRKTNWPCAVTCQAGCVEAAANERTGSEITAMAMKLSGMKLVSSRLFMTATSRLEPIVKVGCGGDNQWAAFYARRFAA
jgi:hypothetical protein